MANVVDNLELDSVLEMISTFTNTEKLVKEALVKISPPDGVQYTIDEKLEKLVSEKLNEGKLMLAVRACENVTLKKIPECKSQKSRASTAREAKRLIGKLEGPAVPGICLTRLDEAMTGKKS